MSAVLVEDGVDAGLVWHHGNPVAEARAIEAGEAVVDLSNRDILEITGADRLGWLHSLTSQHLESLEPGSSVGRWCSRRTGTSNTSWPAWTMGRGCWPGPNRDAPPRWWIS